MRQPTSYTRVLGGVCYSVGKSTLLADDAWWDGHNFERHGRNSFLYRSPGGRYFIVTLSCWQGERDALMPIEEADAIDLYENVLTEHYVTHTEAFPGVKIEDA